MAVEYDLVVIGGSTVGVYAAAAAARFQARVALVDPQLSKTKGKDLSWKHKHGLIQVSRVAQQLREANKFGIYWDTGEKAPHRDISVRFSEAMQWTDAFSSTLELQQEPAILASLGVDVIADAGQFSCRPQPVFEVGNRRLRASAYLISTGSRFDVLDIEGLQSTGYLTPETLTGLKKLPKTVAVIGGEPVGVELAQSLAQLGSSVTLVVSSPQILPKEDPEASGLVQAQLEAEGIRILTQTEVIQAKPIDNKKWIQAGNQAIEADEIVLAMGRRPNVESLNLEAVGVKCHRHYIQTNQKLQTTNPCIYACGDAIGGYRFAHLATYEARIALKNALFLPAFNVDYQQIPWAIFSHPELARVGLTEAQAKRRYGKDVLAARQYFKSVDAANLRGETTGFCKIIGRGNGEILGATIVGPQASELIGAIALAMQQKIKVGAIRPDAAIFPTLSDIIYRTTEAWRRQRFDSNTHLQNLLESFFNFRRSWWRG